MSLVWLITGSSRGLGRVLSLSTDGALARRLLDTTDLEIGEIAWFLGFAEMNSLSRAFHQWEGMTPQQ